MHQKKVNVRGLVKWVILGLLIGPVASLVIVNRLFPPLSPHFRSLAWWTVFLIFVTVLAFIGSRSKTKEERRVYVASLGKGELWTRRILKIVAFIITSLAVILSLFEIFIYEGVQTARAHGHMQYIRQEYANDKVSKGDYQISGSSGVCDDVSFNEFLARMQRSISEGENYSCTSTKDAWEATFSGERTIDGKIIVKKGVDDDGELWYAGTGVRAFLFGQVRSSRSLVGQSISSTDGTATTTASTAVAMPSFPKCFGEYQLAGVGTGGARTLSGIGFTVRVPGDITITDTSPPQDSPIHRSYVVRDTNKNEVTVRAFYVKAGDSIQLSSLYDPPVAFEPRSNTWWKEKWFDRPQTQCEPNPSGTTITGDHVYVTGAGDAGSYYRDYTVIFSERLRNPISGYPEALTFRISGDVNAIDYSEFKKFEEIIEQMILTVEPVVNRG